MKRNTTTFGTYPKIYAYIVVSSVCIVVEELVYMNALHTHTHTHTQYCAIIIINIHRSKIMMMMMIHRTWNWTLCVRVCSIYSFLLFFIYSVFFYYYYSTLDIYVFQFDGLVDWFIRSVCFFSFCFFFVSFGCWPFTFHSFRSFFLHRSDQFVFTFNYSGLFHFHIRFIIIMTCFILEQNVCVCVSLHIYNPNEFFFGTQILFILLYDDDDDDGYQIGLTMLYNKMQYIYFCCIFYPLLPVFFLDCSFFFGLPLLLCCICPVCITQTHTHTHIHFH